MQKDEKKLWLQIRLYLLLGLMFAIVYAVIGRVCVTEQILLQEDIEGKQKELKTLPYTSLFARDPYCISWQALMEIYQQKILL